MDSVREHETGESILPFVLTAVLVAVSIGTIVGATFWLWELPWAMGSRQIVICTCNGMLMSLPVLCSIWLVLGMQTWIIRIPLAIGIELMMLCAFLLTISSFASNAPAEVYWLFAGVVLAVSIAIQIPLWILRIWMGVRVTRSSITHTASDSQFSIRHLLICTTVVAITIPLVQWLDWQS